MRTWQGVSVAMVMAAMLASLLPGSEAWTKDPQWTVQVRLDTDVEFVCNSTELALMAGDSLEWRDPQDDVIRPTANNFHKYELTNRNGVERYALKIKKVALSDKGVYRCIAYRGTTLHGQMIRGLNIYRPVMSGIEAYTYNLIVAFVASGVFLVLLLATCGLLRYNYEARARASLKAGGSMASHDNAFRASAATQDTTASQDTADITQDTELDTTNLNENNHHRVKAMEEGGIGNPAFNYDKHAEAMGADQIDTRL